MGRVHVFLLRLLAGALHLLARILFILAPISMMAGLAHAAGSAMWSPSANELDAVPIGVSMAIVAFLAGCGLLSRSNQLEADLARDTALSKRD